MDGAEALGGTRVAYSKGQVALAVHRLFQEVLRLGEVVVSRGLLHDHVSFVEVRGTSGAAGGPLEKHGIAKNDPFGAYFAATPSFLAWRDPSG